MPYKEKVLFTGMLAGYFVHNIFVFDNMVSYVLFFATLAYINVRTRGYSLGHGNAIFGEEQMQLLWVPVIGLVLIVTQYYVNYRPLMVNRLVIKGMSIQQYAQTMSFADALKVSQDAFVSAIGMRTLGSEEAREQFLQMGMRLGQINIPQETPQAEKQALIQAIGAMVQAAKNDVAMSFPEHKEDVRMMSIYGMFYNSVADPVDAEQVLTVAHKLAPNKQLLSFDLIRSYLLQKKYADAYALAKTVYDSAPAYPDSQKWYMVSAAYSGAFKEARTHLKENGQNVSIDSDVLTAVVTTGQIPLALELLNEVKKTNPEYSAQVDAFIQKILAQPRN